ncbi:hypothetical protein TELCIR_07950, partial [Teladorsagia circumcincta]
VAQAIRHWWRQVHLRGIGPKVIFRRKFSGQPIEMFTRMAWASTYRVGCFVQPCSNNRWTVVCHYSPGGNIVHNRVYTEGRPCSACPLGTFCNPNRLCA